MIELDVITNMSDSHLLVFSSVKECPWGTSPPSQTSAMLFYPEHNFPNPRSLMGSDFQVNDLIHLSSLWDLDVLRHSVSHLSKEIGRCACGSNSRSRGSI